jgi:predicted transcriptional regulator of viral defense system
MTLLFNAINKVEKPKGFWKRGAPYHIAKALVNSRVSQFAITDFDTSEIKYYTLVMAIHRLEKAGFLEKIGRGVWKVL